MLYCWLCCQHMEAVHNSIKRSHNLDIRFFTATALKKTSSFLPWLPEALLKVLGSRDSTWDGSFQVSSRCHCSCAHCCRICLCLWTLTSQCWKCWAQGGVTWKPLCSCCPQRVGHTHTAVWSLWNCASSPPSLLSHEGIKRWKEVYVWKPELLQLSPTLLVYSNQNSTTRFWGKPRFRGDFFSGEWCHF